MSLLKQALSVSKENDTYGAYDAEAGIVLAQDEVATTEAIKEMGAYTAGIASLESMVATAEVLVATDVSVESNQLWATSAAVVAEGLGIEAEVLGTTITTTSIEGVKDIIVKIGLIIKKAFKAAVDFFKKFMLSVARFFSANEKARDMLAEKLTKIDDNAEFEEKALDGVASKAAVVAYALDKDNLDTLKVSGDRISAVVGSFKDIASEVLDEAKMVARVSATADAMMTYGEKVLADVLDSKEVAEYNKDDATLTVIGQKAGKFIGIVGDKDKMKLVELSVNSEKAIAKVKVLANGKKAKDIADDLVKWGDKDDIAKATKTIMDSVEGLSKTAEKDLEGTSEQLQALSHVYRFVISLGFTEAKTILDRYTGTYALGNAVVNGVKKEEKEEEK